MRISGQNSTPTIDNASDTNVGESGTGHTFTAGLTPSSANSLLVIAYMYNVDAGNGVTISSYAIATSDPTWTEQYERGDSGTEGNIGVATAFRPQATDTGNVTVTLSGDPGVNTDHGCILVAVSPEPNVTVTPAVIDLTASVQAPAVSATAVISPAVVDLTAGVQAPTVTTEAHKWANTGKTDTSPTINNTSKS